MVTNETEEMMYQAFKHVFEAFLDHHLEYEDLSFNFHDEMLDRFTERYWREDYREGILIRIKRFLDEHSV